MLDTKLASINTHFMEKYYKDLLKMPAVKSTKNPDGTGTITESTVNEIHKVLRSCFRQAVKWDMMEKNPAVDATVPKAKKQEREIWTAEMLMQALEACDNKMLKIAFHLAFTATLRIGELLGLTWDDMDISEEAIADNKAYVIINKQVLNVFTIPVMAAEPAASETEEIMVASVPSNAKYAGTIYRNGGTVSLGSVTLINNSKLYVYLPKNNNLDLYQGTITFRSGLNVVTKQLANYSTDTWIYTADDIGSGTWTVTVSGYAVGTTQKCEVWYKAGN